MKKFSFLLLAFMALIILIPSYGQEKNIFNCSSFASSGACGAQVYGSNYSFNLNTGSALSGSQILLMPNPGGHTATSLIYLTPVNAQAFTANFTFVPDGVNVAFTLNNTNNVPGFEGSKFVGGAGCEGGFYQAFTPPEPNNVFALELDSNSPLVNNGSSFVYSSASIYQANQSPCIPPYNSDTTPSKISTYPVPLNSPASTANTTTGDTYSATITYNGSSLTLNLYDVTAGGSCPGANCFSYTWDGVNIPAYVGGDTAYVGLNAGSNSNTVGPLYIDSFSYAEGSAPQITVSTPTFSPAPGAYTTAQTVTITDSTSGATIFYTTDGTTPTTSSTPYTGPIAVSTTETLQAFAAAPGDTNSAIASAVYTITLAPPTVAAPTFTPPAGAYSSAQSVTIADATSGATIYYTTNGTTPTTSSTPYTAPITVSATETLRAIAVATGETNSAVATAVYTISSTAPPTTVSTPTFTPPAGAYTSAQSVTITDATSGATVYYTTNGTTPTTSSTPYTGPITVSTTETLQAIAVAAGDTNSAVSSAAYTITLTPPTVSTPTFTPPAGAYTSTQSVTITDATSGATIYYTTDGTTPTTSSTPYTGPITVSTTETLQAIAVVPDDTNSAVASAAYTISSSAPQTTVSTPTFTPPAGAYTSPQWATITDATSGATIYYTTDGTTPTKSSTPYAGPIAVSTTETLQAIAVAPDDTNSAVASAAYTIPLQPGFLLSTSLPSLKVNSGSHATLTLTVTPENGFDSPVTFACSGLPNGVTCSFDQETVTPSGEPATSQLTISTSVQASALHRESRPFFPLTALAMTVCLFGRRKRRGAYWLLPAIAYACLGPLFGCGDLHMSSISNSASTSSTVTVTAVSGTLQQKATVALTIN